MTAKLIATAGLAVAALAGCAPDVDKPTPKAGEVAVKVQQARRETSEATRAAANYSYAQKSEMVQDMKGEIAEINKEAERLAGRMGEASDAARVEAKAKLQDLHKKTVDLNTKLDRAKDSSESRWEDVKAGVKKSYDELNESFKQARQWLSEQIAPS